MDPRIALIIQHLDRLIKSAIEQTIEKTYGGVPLLDYVNAGTDSYLDLLEEGFTRREDGLLVYGPYDLESVAGKGSLARNDLSLAIEPIVGDDTDELLGFRLSLRDQSTVESGGLNPFRKQENEIFFLELGEFATAEEANNLFTKTVDVDGRTAVVSLVGDKLDEIFPNSNGSIEMAFSNKGPVISERIRTTLSRTFAPDYIVKAMEQVDKEQYEQYGELLGDVETPDTVEAAAADIVPDDISSLDNVATSLSNDVQKLEDSINDYLNDIILENPSRDEALAVDPLSIALSDDGKSIEIIELVIDENYRNQGLGSEVLQRLKTFADTNNLNIKTTTISDDLTELAERKGIEVENKKSSLSDDVAEVNNDFVYNKFAEKQRTADNVIFRELDDGTIELLVVKRKRGPHRSLYALPGGIVDSEIINDESIIRSIIDRPSFKRTSGIHKAIENYRLNNKELPGDNLKFAAEALREATEETGLTVEDIVNSAELDVKYNRYDWDARAAQGVDVGGIVLNVNTDWTPKAGDDALKTEWVKLQDVADGKVQLAFGHAEFVKEGFEKFYDNSIFALTNPKNTFYGIYVDNNNPENIIKKLDDVSKQNAQRNINIIKESNPIRKAAGQPEIDITNKTVIDRQNNKLLDSIFRMNEVPFKGKTALASELLRPEMIMNHILQPITDQRNGLSVWDVDYNINENSFKDPKDGKSLKYGDPNFEHRQNWQFKDFTEQKQQNIKRQVQRELVEKYRSFLTSLQTQGMAINHVQIQMLEHFIDLVNSEDFDNLFDGLMNGGLLVDTNINSKATIRGLGDGSLVRSQIYYFAESGNDIDVEFRNNIEALDGTGLEEPMSNILNKHKEFVNNTLPEGALIKPVDAAKDMNFNNTALLDSMGITRSGDTIKGMTYHGANGLSDKGKQVFMELKKVFPEIVNTEVNLERTNNSKNTTFEQAINKFINRVAEQNNLEWLDPRIDRRVGGNTSLLRGNVFYTTSNPFLAASYSMGGFNNPPGTMGYLQSQNLSFYDLIDTIINTPEFLDVTPDADGFYTFNGRPDKINKLDNALKKYGLTIEFGYGDTAFFGPITKSQGILQANYEKAFRVIPIEKKYDTNLRPMLIDPFITQIVYEAPIETFLFTDGQLGPQMNSNIERSLNSLVENVSPSVFMTDQQIQTAAEDLLFQAENRMLAMRPEQRYEFYNKYYSNITELFKDMVDNPSKYRDTIVNILNLYNTRNQNSLNNYVKSILNDGSREWNDIPKFINDNLFRNGNIFGEEIYPTITQDFNESTIEGFKGDRGRSLPNAGELVVADKINDYLVETKGIGDSGMTLKEVDNFISTLDTQIFGSDVIGRRDYETIKFIMEQVNASPELGNRYDEFFQNEITGGVTGEPIETVKRRTIAGEGQVRYGKGVSTTDLLSNRSNGLISFLIDINRQGYLDSVKLGKKNLLEEVYELRNNILDEGIQGLNLSKDEQYLYKYLIDTNSQSIRSTTEGVLRDLVNTESAADYISLKSLSDGGIESTFGSGGSSIKTAYHDTHYIVDPGNKFGSSVPKKQKYTIKTVMPDTETLVLMQKLADGLVALENLNLTEIEKIGEVVPIEHILKNQNIPMEQKIKWQALYTAGGIDDPRYATVEGINPSAVDAPYLLHNEELKNVFNDKLFNNTNNVDEALEVIDNVAKSAVNNFGGDAAEQLVTTGVARTFANGLDLYDAAILAPVIFDLVGSKISGSGKHSDTIGGAVADVAGRVYDPEQTDTVFEEIYGSPSDFSERSINVPNSKLFKENVRGQTVTREVPDSLAASVSQLLTGAKNVTKSSANTLGRLFGVNSLFTNMWEDLKEGAATTFGTIADAHGMNDWIYNFKKDMYVTSVLNESGLNPNSTDYYLKHKQLEDQYKTQFPKIEDRYGNPLDNQGDS